MIKKKSSLGRAYYTFKRKPVARATLGLSKSQRHRLEVIQNKVLKGHGRAGDRTENVEKYGYDTKFAYHAYMVLFLANYVLKSGTYCTYLPIEQQHLVMDIRKGILPLEDYKQLLDATIDNVKHQEAMSNLRSEPDFDKINDFFVDLTMRYFKFK